MALGRIPAPDRPKLKALGVIGREALAFARQAALLHRDLPPTAPAAIDPGDDIVVLLHGLFATAGVLRPLRQRIERDTGAHTASFSYAPGPGVDAIARRLAVLVNALPGDARIHLVGHSMGGVVARWFVHELGGDARVVQTISLGSPFQGTRRAKLLPGASGRDIVPGSPVLRRLASAPSPAVPHLSITALNDSVVTEEAVFHHGERLTIDHCGHNGLLFDRRVADVVVARVQVLRDAEPEAGLSFSLQAC